MFEELMNRDEAIATLQEQNAVLTMENRSMRNTIDTVLRVKCKRGEGAFSLNTELKSCVETNARMVVDHYVRKTVNKVSEIVTDILLHTLVGLDGKSIPCAILHNNPPIVVYKDHDIWVAKTLSEFSDLYYQYMQSHVLRYSREHVNEDTSDNQVSVLNTLLNPQQFMSHVKLMIRLYKDY